MVGEILIVAGSALADGQKGPPPTEGTVQVYLGLKRQTEALESFVAQVSDPANEEMYGMYLGVRQVTKMLGVSKIAKKKTRFFFTWSRGQRKPGEARSHRLNLRSGNAQRHGNGDLLLRFRRWVHLHPRSPEGRGDRGDGRHPYQRAE